MVGIAALVIAAVGVFSGTPAVPSSTHHQQVALASPTTSTSTTAPPPAGPPTSTTVATLNGDIPGYASPESGRPSMTVPGSWCGYASKLPVITTEPGWRRLPGRCPHGREQGFRGDASHLGGLAVQSRDSRA
jgi:hypothetical protein